MKRKNFEEAKKTVGKGALLKEINKVHYPSKVCKRFGISNKIYTKLLKFYKIKYDFNAWQKKAGNEKFRKDYYAYMRKLGHHPSSFEIQKNYRSLFKRVFKLYGTFGNFRKKFGIKLKKR